MMYWFCLRSADALISHHAVRAERGGEKDKKGICLICRSLFNPNLSSDVVSDLQSFHGTGAAGQGYIPAVSSQLANTPSLVGKACMLQ